MALINFNFVFIYHVVVFIIPLYFHNFQFKKNYTWEPLIVVDLKWGPMPHQKLLQTHSLKKL